MMQRKVAVNSGIYFGGPPGPRIIYRLQGASPDNLAETPANIPPVPRPMANRSLRLDDRYRPFADIASSCHTLTMDPDDPDQRTPVELWTDRYPSSFIAGALLVHLVSILRDAACIARLAAKRLFQRR